MGYREYEKKLEYYQKLYDKTYMKIFFASLGDFGHMDEFHINMSSYKLKERLVKKDKEKKLKMASSFYGQKEEILKMTQDLLVDSAEELAEYMADEEDDEPWILMGNLSNNVTGRAFLRDRSHDWKEGPLTCSRFIIAIQKNHDGERFHVTSCYPVF
jgi:hypothetical protein